MSSVYVVCWIFLQTSQTYFCIQANSVDPDERSSLIWVYTICNNDFQSNRQKTKQMTVVMFGILRIKWSLETGSTVPPEQWVFNTVKRNNQICKGR